MRFSKTSIWVIAALSLLSLGSVLVLHLAGFRFFTIATPSMGETAPVGTLIVTQPQQSYNKDDIITFYRSGSVYTHRLTKINDDHSYTTKGDLNAVEDSLSVANRDVIGKAVVIAPVWGWVWRAAPILLIGWIIVYLLSCIKRLRERWRWPVRIIGGTLVVILATLILNPWLRADMLSIATHQKNDVRLHIVNTGIFPIRDDDGNRVHTGQTAIVRATETDAQGHYIYVPRPSLGPTGVVFALLWCLLPLFIALLVKLPPPEEEITGLQLVHERNRNMALLAIIILFEVVLLTVQLSSLAGFTVTIQNSINHVQSRAYFKCSEATWIRSQIRPNPQPYFAWALNSDHAANPVVTDLSGNNNHGKPSPSDGSPSRASVWNTGCVRDDRRISVFNGVNACLTHGTSADQKVNPAPNTFSLEVWFSTTKKSNGRLMGFSSLYEGDYNYGGQSDRHIYIDKDGRVVFGAYSGGIKLVTSQAGVNYADGRWHHVVATMSPNGAALYLDGNQVDTNPSMTAGENVPNGGYWKVGCGKLTYWKNADGSEYQGPKYFTGSMQYSSVYTTALTEQQARDHYLAGAS